MKNNACKRISIDQKAQSTEQLSSRSQPRWIENLSRIYRPDRKFLNRDKVQKARWIKIVLTYIEKEDQRSSIDSLVVERYQEAVKIAQK